MHITLTRLEKQDNDTTTQTNPKTRKLFETEKKEIKSLEQTTFSQIYQLIQHFNANL